MKTGVSKFNSYNRREQNRTRCSVQLSYVGPYGQVRKATIINVSKCGARVCCDNSLHVGDEIILISYSRSGNLRYTRAQLRWTKSLSDQHQIAGLAVIQPQILREAS